MTTERIFSYFLLVFGVRAFNDHVKMEACQIELTNTVNEPLKIQYKQRFHILLKYRIFSVKCEHRCGNPVEACER